MTIFPNAGKENTETAVRIAVQKAAELRAPLVVASISGNSALAAQAVATELQFTGPLIVVRSVSAPAQNGVNRMNEEIRTRLEAGGAQIVTAAHALSAGERGIARKFQGIYPLQLIANTLYMIGQGFKVCVECAIMALDADAVRWGEPVVALGGSGVGLDTAVVITPAYSANILDTKVHEILCKPGCYGSDGL